MRPHAFVDVDLAAIAQLSQNILGLPKIGSKLQEIQQEERDKQGRRTLMLSILVFLLALLMKWLLDERGV